MDNGLQGPGVLDWNGTKYKTLLSKEQTDGKISVVDSLSPVGSGPPKHIHHNEDETFFMISGKCEVWIEGTTTEHGPGEAVFIPRGKEHTFRVIGDEPSRHLVILNPGGFEGFFAAMADGQYQVPDDMPTINAFAEKYNMTFTGPPLGA
ncbi:cupin domain-containing protein [Maritalea porphyrae]|uniref:Cupin type-2 domain-containing protein n=1 Tax=Maritalea porphyrae TaxID=880732 RepID=A0ABQ5UMP5_9HYPH|nr:cupin domain-containing protein [Maritalea porphyrae]GLQ16104.1 hypothetical protein GCM10007879_03530 [Maritalea porphyrae]